MITFISFIIIMVGAANWLCIGLMQYDFVAGFFGTQSSFLSRLIYIVVGFAAIWFLFMAIKQKGTIKLNSNGFKKNQDPLQANKKFEPRDDRQEGRQNEHSYNENQTLHSNVEFGRDYGDNNSKNNHNPFD